MNEKKFPYQDHIFSLEEGQEEIIFINDRPFLIRLATESDVERINKGCFLFGD